MSGYAFANVPRGVFDEDDEADSFFLALDPGTGLAIVVSCSCAIEFAKFPGDLPGTSPPLGGSQWISMSELGTAGLANGVLIGYGY